MRSGFVNYIYERNSKGFFISMLGLLLAIISIVIAIVLLVERKKKKEDKELDDYLENSIQ